MSVILPFRGEFGLKLRYHVPAVYALGSGHVIMIEKGEEALYPLAAGWIPVDRREDDERRGWTEPEAPYLREQYPETIELRKGEPEERFLPAPWKFQGTGAVDVVICPRMRNYASSKNWQHWPWLAESLEAEGLKVFAAGAPDSSVDVGCARAWDYVRFLDASIEAMLGARLVVATDAGLAHLAVLCGRPLLLITYEGLVAPGPVLDVAGHAMEPAYWPVRLEEYYYAANHLQAPIHVSNAWRFQEGLKEEICELVS